MAENSKIEWTTHTFNGWRGCVKVHEGCAHCYAESQAKRNPGTLGIWGAHGTRVVASEAMWRQPLKWEAEAKKAFDTYRCGGGPNKAPYERPRVFCASMADVFEDFDGPLMLSSGDYIYCDLDGSNVEGMIHHTGDAEGQLDPRRTRPLTLADIRRWLFALIDATPNLDWLLLTKRPENVRRMWCSHVNTDGRPPSQLHRPNVWLGTSVSFQGHADQQIPELLKCHDLAANLFLSIEPLLGPLKITPFLGGVSYECKCGFHDTESELVFRGGSDFQCPNCFQMCRRGGTLDWVIVGGESGQHARPMHPDWVRSLRDQCQAAAVPFFFKQWGEWLPREHPVSKSVPVLPLMDPGRHGVFNDQGVFKINDGTFSDYANLLGQEMYRVGKKLAGRTLDGRTWSEFPANQPQEA